MRYGVQEGMWGQGGTQNPLGTGLPPSSCQSHTRPYMSNVGSELRNSGCSVDAEIRFGGPWGTLFDCFPLLCYACQSLTPLQIPGGSSAPHP